MLKRPREYHRPADLVSALELLRHPNTAPLLLGPRVPENLYEGAEAVVDLGRLDLAYIHEDAKGALHIGALTPLSTVAESDVIRSRADGLLAKAARVAAASGLRDVATVGGALLTHAGPSEVRLALEALQATPILEGAPPGQLLREVVLPPLPAETGGALERVARAPRDEAIVAVAVVVTRPTGQARVAVGPSPIFSASGKSDAISQVLDGWQPISDFRASADYRKAMAGVLARRALEAAWRNTENH